MKSAPPMKLLQQAYARVLDHGAVAYVELPTACRVIADLQREVERLREALQRIVDYVPMQDVGSPEGHIALFAKRTANEALARKETP